MLPKPAGYNPMRHDCHLGGRGENCFNVTRRPKIEVFADCFPRKCNFGDIDGAVELGGHICLLEWKGEGGVVSYAQSKTYQAHTRYLGNVVFVVMGDAKTMSVRGYSIWWRGRHQPFVACDLDTLKQRLRRWATWADKARAAA